jgi:hypothetical protein
MKHLKYLWYVVKHKWFVFLGCVRYGIIWQGIIHDLSKLSKEEWSPYVEHFYGTPNKARFLEAWKHHWRNNPHHWNYWVRDGLALPMPRCMVLEMVADWRGAGKATGNPDTKAWYRNNRDKIQLHDRTRKEVEELLGV